MARIFKYPLAVEHRQLVYMHSTAEPLWVTQQNDQLILYAKVQDPPGEPEPRVYQVITTGDVFEDEGKEFVGACTIGGWFQAFVFRVVTPNLNEVIDQRHSDDFKEIAAISSVAS